jgi:hypothetical protein
MSKSESQKREDEVLLRMLKTKPKPHAPLKASKAKPSRVSRTKKKPAKV